MKMPNILKRIKLRAATARRSASAAEIDYDEIPEPNMKLSRALLIVLLLHVVAVSGIIAFNVIKTRQGPLVPTESVTSEAGPTADNVQSTPDSGVSGPHSAAVLKESRSPDGTHQLDPAKTVAKDQDNAERAKPIEHAKLPASSGKTYTVVKGDNPVKIAKKFNVSYEDLIALNHIADPRKLKVGQKLLIPKTTKAKKNTK